MDRREIYKRFLELTEYFYLQLAHNNIANALTRKYLMDFPNKLPKEIAKAIEKDKPIVLKELDKIYKKSKSSKTQTDAFLKFIRDSKIEADLKENISFSIIHLMKRKEEMESIFGINAERYFDFEYSILAQTLVMFHSILEGYLKQVLILLKKLDIKLRKRKIPQRLASRLEILRDELEVAIPEMQDFERILNNVEQIRHIIVHNNGIVDKRFLENTGYQHLKIDDRIMIEPKNIAIIGVTITYLVLGVSEGILDKYFSEFKKNAVKIHIYLDGTKVERMS